MFIFAFSCFFQNRRHKNFFLEKNRYRLKSYNVSRFEVKFYNELHLESTSFAICNVFVNLKSQGSFRQHFTLCRRFGWSIEYNGLDFSFPMVINIFARFKPGNAIQSNHYFILFGKAARHRSTRDYKVNIIRR